MMMVFRPEHVVRVRLAQVRGDHMAEVSERLDRHAFVILGDEEHLARDPHGPEKRYGLFRPRLVPEVEGFDDLDLVIGCSSREGRAERKPFIFFGVRWE